MSKSYLKGITLEINGKTDKLANALEDVTQKSKDIESELREVNKQLKFDPKNTELLAQKQKLLGDAISTSKEKLDTLKKAETQARDEFSKGKISEEQYRALAREISATEGKLKGLEDQAKKANGQLTDKAALKNLENIGIAAATAVGAFGAAALGTVQGTKELREELGRLEVNSDQAGANLELTNDALRDLNAISDDNGANVEALSNLLQAGFTDSNLATIVEELSGAVIKFPDTLKIEGLADGLQETLATGQAIGPFSELLERMGVDLDVFNQGLTDAIANGEESNFVMETLSSLGLSEVNDAFRENNASLIENAEAQHDLKIATAELGELLEPLVARVTELIADLILKLTDVGVWMSENQTLMTIIGIALATFVTALIAYNIHAAWATIVTWTMTTAAGAFAAVMAFLTSPITLVIVGIGALIAIGVLLWKNWDNIAAFGKKVWGGIGDFIGNIVDGIAGGIKKMANGVIDALNWLIRGANKLKFDIPDWVPLLGGKKFGLNIPVIPRFDVGTKFLPEDMLIQAHKGEMIVPRNENPYANSSGSILPQSDPRDLALAIRKELEKANIVAVISEENFNNKTDRRIMLAY